MKRNYLFIDDSGDVGFKDESSSHFLIAAVLIVDEESKQVLCDEIDSFRRNLGWGELDEFKFNTTNKRTVLKLIRAIKEFNFSAYIMVLDKSKVDPGNVKENKTNLYYQMIKELIFKLDPVNPIITIDGRAGKQYAKEIKTYLRKCLREKEIYDSRIYLVDSRKNSLIQLADIIVGSVARSLNKNKTDNQIYIKALGNKIVKVYDYEP